jgi:hypothetical protein
MSEATQLDRRIKSQIKRLTEGIERLTACVHPNTFQPTVIRKEIEFLRQALHGLEQVVKMKEDVASPIIHKPDDRTYVERCLDWRAPGDKHNG